jgi:hypothetical protein
MNITQHGPHLRQIEYLGVTAYAYTGHGSYWHITPMAHMRSTQIELRMPMGLFYDPADKLGLSHFAEHCCFHGTSQVPLGAIGFREWMEERLISP